jgi:hypothetical protein
MGSINSYLVFFYRSTYLDQCPTQRAANYASLAKELRPPNPSPPSIPCPPQDAKQAQVDAWNEVAYKIYRDHQAMCFRNSESIFMVFDVVVINIIFVECGRKFEPDRLPAHMRGCHATGNFSYGHRPEDSVFGEQKQQPTPAKKTEKIPAFKPSK